MPILASSPIVSSLEHLVGFFVVVLALTLLWILTAVIGKLFIRSSAATPAVASGSEYEPSEEEVAAIAACLFTVMGRRSRIVSIRRGRTTDWNREGRREHFSSRRIR
jgi:hypothetical protein